MRQESFRAAAEDYADLSEVQSDCYHYLNDGFDLTIQSRLAEVYKAKLLNQAAPDKYISKIVCTALSECQYPVNEATGYAWSSNQRAAFASIPKATWSRNNLSNHINFILKDINLNSRIAWSAISYQLES